MIARVPWAAPLLLAFLVVPAGADIVPNEPVPAAENPAAREAVRARLDSLGVDAIEARKIVEGLKADEAEFFAKSANANTVVAGLWIEEWIGAAIYFVLVGPAIEKNIRKYILLE